MTISDSFTSEHVGFVPVGICFGSPEHFPVDPALGNVALARKHLSPAIPVTVLHPVSVEEESGEVILNVDIHCLAAFDEGIEECRNFRTALGNAEKEGLSSYHKGACHVLGGLIAGCCTWDVEECHEAFLPFKRVCKSDGECAFRHGRCGVLAAEFEDSFNERLKYSSPLSQVFIIGGEIACKPPVPEQSFLMEEVGIKPDKLECSTGSPFAACLNGLAPGMNPASHMREITVLPRIGITAQPVRLEGSAIVSYDTDKSIVTSVFSVGKDYRSLGSVRICCRPDRHVGMVNSSGL